MPRKIFSVPKPALVISALFLLGSASACGTSGSSDADKTTTTDAKSTTSTVDDEATTTTADEPGSTTTTAAPGGGDRDGYVAALTENLMANDESGGQIEFESDEAKCVATEWVDIIGVDTFEANGVSLTDVGTNDFQYSGLGIGEDEASDMIDAIDGCGIDAIARLRVALDQGLDPAQQKCLATELDDKTARSILVGTIYLDEPGEDLSAEFDRISTTCQLQ